MATLSTDAPGEVRLTLRGETDNRILATLRRWLNWLRVDIERDPVDAARTLSVTLVADQSHEAIVRDILKRSFSITFPKWRCCAAAGAGSSHAPAALVIGTPGGAGDCYATSSK